MDGWELYICRRVPSNFSEEGRTSQHVWTILARGKEAKALSNCKAVAANSTALATYKRAISFAG